jgi:hypothetical protein
MNNQSRTRTHVIITADQKEVITQLAKATAKTFSASLRDVLEAGIPRALDNQHEAIVKRLEHSRQALELQRKQVASQEQTA